jgi:hypothetical protein
MTFQYGFTSLPLPFCSRFDQAEKSGFIGSTATSWRCVCRSAWPMRLVNEALPGVGVVLVQKHGVGVGRVPDSARLVHVHAGQETVRPLTSPGVRVMRLHARVDATRRGVEVLAEILHIDPTDFRAGLSGRGCEQSCGGEYAADRRCDC